jgi:hypothetical protein
MAPKVPVALSLRSRQPFPIRAVVAALHALADDLDDIAAGKKVDLSERVKWVRKDVANAEAWLYLLHVVCDRSPLDGTDLRELAVSYQSVMATRRTPVRRLTAGAPRTAPPLPMLPVELKRKPSTKEVDGA